MNRTRVVLADDHTLVRAGLRKLLESIPDMEVVGEASDGIALLELATALEPKLILMDIAMPGLNGLEATARVVKASPQTRVVILSMHQSEEYVRQALRNGAAAYLLKDAAPLELNHALKAVLRGEIYLSPAVSKGVMSDYVQRLRGDCSHARAADAPATRNPAVDRSGKEHERDRQNSGHLCKDGRYAPQPVNEATGCA